MPTLFAELYDGEDEEELYEKEDDEIGEVDELDPDADEDEVICLQCGEVIEDGVQCSFCGWVRDYTKPILGEL